MNMNEAVKYLSFFSASEGVPHVLTTIHKKLVETLDDEVICSLRAELKKVLSDPRKSVKDAAFKALLELAESYPLNEYDPITHDKICPQNRVVVSAGYQFDIYALIEWHNFRPFRAELDEGVAHYKWLLNPVTNQPFFDQDIEHIESFCSKINLEIQGELGNVEYDVAVFLSSSDRDRIANDLGQLIELLSYFRLCICVANGLSLIVLYCILNKIVNENPLLQFGGIIGAGGLIVFGLCAVKKYLDIEIKFSEDGPYSDSDDELGFVVG